MKEKIVFTLIPSPLVGPLTWKLVASQLAEQGHQVIIANPTDSETDTRPYWEQHAESAAAVINGTAVKGDWLLVGHSGAGPLLPAIGDRLARAPAGFLFVDAGLPQPQASRLDLMKAEAPVWAAEFEQYLLADGRFPTWSDAALQPLIPDETLRRHMLAEMRPRSLPYFMEKLSVPDDWAKVHCGYIQFTDSYHVPASQAQAWGWPFIRFQAGHFHMLVDATAVTQAIITVAVQMLQTS